MHSLLDLSDKPRSVWNATITEELTAAGVPVQEVPGKDLPTYRAPYDVHGRFGAWTSNCGPWTFSRESVAYAFWGDVPLATAEAIAKDPECAAGCMPGQWLPSWGPIPDHVAQHARYHEFVVWIEDGFFRTKDDLADRDDLREVYQKEANWKLKFVDDPSAAGKPYIQTYTFFTLAALKNFVEVVKRHRVDFIYTH